MSDSGPVVNPARPVADNHQTSSDPSKHSTANDVAELAGAGELLFSRSAAETPILGRRGDCWIDLIPGALPEIADASEARMANAAIAGHRPEQQSACRRSSMRRREARVGVLLAMPWILGFLFIIAGPMMIGSIVLSFTSWDLLTPIKWVGLRNPRTAVPVPHRGQGAELANSLGADGSARPFLLCVSYPEPHNPFQVPEPYDSMFPPESPPPDAADAAALSVKGFKYQWCRDAFMGACPDFAETLSSQCYVLKTDRRNYWTPYHENGWGDLSNP